MKLARSEEIDSKLKKWNKTLPLIQDLLADTGQTQITQSVAQRWLNNLQDLAYEVDELNEESYQASNSAASKVLKFVPTCCTNFSLMYGYEMSSKLDEIPTKLDGLGLNVYSNVESSDRTERWWDKTSAIDEYKIMGREGDNEALLVKLLRGDEDVRILLIVGIGGFGKINIAKVMYKVNDHFGFKAWVCVSDVIDVKNISNTIYDPGSGTTIRI